MDIQDAASSRASQTMSLRQALEQLEKSVTKILLVTDEKGRLVGTATDGDFRRAIISGAELDDTLDSIANRTPFVFRDDDLMDVESELVSRDIDYAPIVDADGILLGLAGQKHLPRTSDKVAPIVLMAGGLGRRLMPLTENCPKPLLQLGDKPILEHIILRFREQGFRRFYISIGYLGHMVEDYFGDGDHMDVHISYIREDKRLGTAGALSLLPRNMGMPFIVMNGDLLTDMDFDDLIGVHVKTGATATMCIREHRTNIAFGVVESDGHRYQETREKPTLTHHINAGIYCVSREALRYVPDDKFYDMPTLFSDLVNAKHDCSVHLMRDTWIDIGSKSEFEAAQSRFMPSDEEGQ
ncbi:nucleotidyltransferase family protein [uncultured Algimonas sp.]|uniref:nucleotidyltransferase family protein n=1 Tax=uncultured Algimonas sp. TaxID=1547920 RepID=UPI002614BB46|nr:nucleotidyltransferase family protein [uncultured Algimonas sp.]